MRGPAEGLRHGRWAILNAPTGVRLAPSPVQGAAPEEGQREPHRRPSSEVPPAHNTELRETRLCTFYVPDMVLHTFTIY